MVLRSFMFEEYVGRMGLWWGVAFSTYRRVALLVKPLGHVELDPLVGLSSLFAFVF